MGVLPPKDCSPDRLFRLVSHPRATLPISYRVGGAEAWKLSVRALPTVEWSECLDEAEDALEELKPGKSLAALVARALLANGRPAFDNAEQVLDLSDDEVQQLSSAVLIALDRLCPPRGRCDEGEWHRVLTLGARHGSNATARYALGTSFDIAGGLYLDRPHLYYGLPSRELTDGHWLCYRVCKKLVEDASK